jgi:hypothetical protein
MPHPDDCLQHPRFEALEKANNTTANELAKINNTLVRIETTLSGKVVIYDKHVDEGDKFRTSVMFWIITTLLLSLGSIGATAVTFGIWMGKIQTQVDVNTTRWERLYDDQARSHSQADIR